MKKTFLSMLLVGSSCAVFAQVEQTTTDTVPTTTTPTTQPTMNNGSTPDDKTTLASSGQYAAYSAAVSVPSSIQTQFTTANPGASDVRWEQNNQWYRASYKVGAHRMRMMYDMRGNSWAIALPVTSGLIPDEVIERAYTLYGDNVYDITRLKTAPKAMTSSTTTTTTTGTDVTANNSTTVNNVDNSAAVNNNQNSGTGMSTSTMNVGGEIYQVRIIENGVLRTERMNEDGTPYTEAYWRVDSVDANNMNNQNMNQQNWNNNNQNMNQQPTTTDSTQSGGGQGSMNMNNSSNSNSTNSTDNTNNQAPSSPSDNGSSSTPNTDATMPSSEPRLQK